MDNSNLNPEQMRAVKTVDGPVLILAGAGSGKTRALTYRIAYLIEEKGVSPYEILALTFTNKAAKEMVQRVSELTGDERAHLVWISTFHSFCAKVLRIDIVNLAGFTRDFVIYDDVDQLALIVEVQKELNIKEEDYPKRALRALFSEAKNRSLQPAQYIAASGQQEMHTAAYKLYEKKLRSNNAMDFDDLILRTLELFEQCPMVLEKYQQRFRYIHVDEYQDTNMTQYSLVCKLADKHRNICVVGDDDQSIYGWRGADIRNILGFEKDFKNATVIRLEQNYRSDGFILDAANAIISNNSERKEKKLWTKRGKGEKIGFYTAWSDKDEADFVCRTITSACDCGKQYSDFAVLYRTNAQSRMIEDMLVAYGIPYTIYGSLKFYDRKEIKDILAYLRLMVNPNDEISLRRIINVPKRGIGEAAVAELQSAAQKLGITMFEACLRVEDISFSGRVKSKLKAFGSLIIQLRVLNELLSLSDFTKQLLDLIDFWAYLAEEKRTDGKKDDTRKENVQEFLSAIVQFEETVDENTTQAFLENVSLVANVNEGNDQSSVTLMTLHSAKGLEFPSVFMVGMEDGIFPTSRALFSQSSMEEERRLCYVGITRAMEKLYMTRATNRMQYNDVKRNPPSRFLEEIPKSLFESGVENQDETSRQPSNMKTITPIYQQPPGSHYKEAPMQKNTRKPILGGSAIQTKPQAKNAYKFTLYQTVEHAKFGQGSIIEMDGGVLTIDFVQVGVKKIVGAYAPIKPMED